jgi:hypothetical protein
LKLIPFLGKAGGHKPLAFSFPEGLAVSGGPTARGVRVPAGLQ